jgi:hypothetical protein
MIRESTIYVALNEEIWLIDLMKSMSIAIYNRRFHRGVVSYDIRTKELDFLLNMLYINDRELYDSLVRLNREDGRIL